MPDTNDELKKLHLDAMSGPYLLKVRANYIVQLLVSIASSTAVNLKPLFTALHPTMEKSKALLRKLRDLDQCLMSLDSMCSAWVTALDCILSHGDFVLHEVLLTAKIKAATPAAIKLVQESGGDSTQVGGRDDGSTKNHVTDGSGDDEKQNGPVVLSMNDLLTFGSTHIGLDSTESLLLLQLNVQQAIINHAYEIEKNYRDMVSVVIQPPESSEAKPNRRGAGRSTGKAELLFKITDPSAIKQATFDPNLALFRLPADFGLVFGGTVGDLVTLTLYISNVFDYASVVVHSSLWVAD